MANPAATDPLFVVREDGTPVCVCPCEEAARAVSDALGPGFTPRAGTAGERLRWTHALEVTQGALDDIANETVWQMSTTAEDWSGDALDRVIARRAAEAYGDYTRAQAFLRLWLEGKPRATATVPAGMPSTVDDAEYRPASWFPKGMADRLRQAASKTRKTKRVDTRKIDGVVCYSVADARRWWPSDVPKNA